MPRERKLLRLEDITILIDSREKMPLHFEFGPPTEATKVRTRVVSLDTGDYSVLGLEKDECAIERKSLSDLCLCVGSGRERFEREVYRLLAFKCKAVVVEASWDELMLGHWRGQITPRQVMGSVIGWQSLGIPFFFHPSREVIAKYVSSILWIHARRCHRRLLNFSGKENAE